MNADTCGSGSTALVQSRAVDPQTFFADPDPAVFLNADPNPADFLNADPDSALKKLLLKRKKLWSLCKCALKI